MTVGSVNSASQQDYKITAQADQEPKTLRERIKAEIEEKEKAGAAHSTMTPQANGEQGEGAQNRLNDKVEISAEGRAKATQPEAAVPDKDDKKPESKDDKKKKAPVSQSAADDSQWQAEIAKIRQKRTQLLQQIGSADEDERKNLEAQLAQAEAELAAKDNDAYRKARTNVTDLGTQAEGAADAAKLS